MDQLSAEGIKQVEDNYAQGAERPLGSYALLASLYVTALASMVAVVRRRRVSVPDHLSPADLALMTVSTYRASRLLTKDSITAVLRAPFTTFKEAAGEGEVNEEVVGKGLPHAVGELLTCPFCVSVWIATTTAFGLLVLPRFTRMATSVMAAVAGSDFLQFAFAAIRD